MRHFVSPNFTHEKLEPPLYKDIVDVFEDRLLYWLIVPAKKLLQIKHGAVPAVALATSYIEAIEIYITGKDSNSKSKVFFRRGCRRIFGPASGETYMQDALADALYESLRCGFAHDAMFRSGIAFNSRTKKAMLVTWPKKGGRFDPEGKMASAIINPRRFVECIEHHFTEYIKELRSRKDNPAKEAFRRAVELKWRLGEPGPYVAMTEEQFQNEA